MQARLCATTVTVQWGRFLLISGIEWHWSGVGLHSTGLWYVIQVSAAMQANLAQEQHAYIQFYEELQTEQVRYVLCKHIKL